MRVNIPNVDAAIIVQAKSKQRHMGNVLVGLFVIEKGILVKFIFFVLLELRMRLG